ncbi:MotA/TolQ/ExbB proton channel family protein [Planctomycetota bacterium]
MTEIAEYWRAGGPLMIPLAAVCFAIWYWVISLLRRLHEEHTGLPPRIERYATSDGTSPETIRDRLLELRLTEVSPFGRQLKILRALVVSAPLLGLLGTVKGMIATFLVLSARGAASIELISTGISEALVTTQVGLVIALPGLFGAYAIERRLRNLNGTLDQLEAHLVSNSAGKEIP